MKRIAIVVPRASVRDWHERLRRRLQAVAPEVEARLIGVDGGEDYPAPTRWLLEFERHWFRPRGALLCERSSAPVQPLDAEADFDLVIDLTTQAPTLPRGALVVRPLYDGAASELAAVAALLAGAAPTLALQDASTGALVAEGLPSLEIAQGLTGGLEAVFSRVITLVEQVLLSPLRRGGRPALSGRPRPEAAATAAFLARSVGVDCVRRLYHLLCHSPHWRIGWRFHDGPGVLETGALSGPGWNDLFASGSGFAADPFPIEWNGESYIFYERLDYAANKGAIFAQRLDAGGARGEPVLALEEPWHLSYPFLIEQDGALYMIPEASASNAVSIYRCLEFPSKWECEGPLISGVEAADATVFSHGGRLWMTSVVRDGVGGYSDTLAIHHADRLMGPWREHARRPALVDSRLARPAGAVVRRDGALWRPVQDCSIGYGKRLILARIDKLDSEAFEQTVVSELAPGAHWPGTRLHTLNRWGRLECIDGAQAVPKNALVAQAVQATRESRAGSRMAAEGLRQTLALSPRE